jgi:glycosyltransferase involved in cell wall biosynthesis
MKILYLYSEIGAYNIPVLRCLVADHGAEVHVVAWDRAKLKPFSPPAVSGVTYYARSQLTEKTILELAERICPDLIYISGWMDRGYLPTASLFKRRGVPVVTGFDDQWVGNLRQRVGAAIFPFYYRRFFSHAWVAGPRQYEFARRLGFASDEILFDLLTCDYTLFNDAAETLAAKRSAYPRTFLYVGNFRAVKGTDILARAYREYRTEHGGTWPLLCAGNGEMQSLLEGEPGIELLGFVAQSELARLCARAGVFILPSRHDQWGVVVHEFAAAGLPLLVSAHVGAKATFLVEGFNGRSYPGNNPDALSRMMAEFSNQSDAALLKMSENSRRLARRIDPSVSAASLVSAISRKKKAYAQFPN